MIIFNAWASARIAPSGSTNNSSQFDINEIKSQAVDGFFANLRSTISGQYSKPNIVEKKFVFGILCKLVNKSDIDSSRRLTVGAELIFQDLFFAVRDTSERSKGKHTLYKHLIVMLDKVLQRYSDDYNNLSCNCKDEFYKTAVDKDRLNRLINSIHQSASNIVSRNKINYEIAEKGECRKQVHALGNKQVHNLANIVTKRFAESGSRPQTAPSRSQEAPFRPQTAPSSEHARPAPLKRRLPVSRPNKLSSSESWFDSQVKLLASYRGLSSKIVKNTLTLLIDFGSLNTLEDVACCRDILAKLKASDLVGKRWFDDSDSRLQYVLYDARVQLVELIQRYLDENSDSRSNFSSFDLDRKSKLEGNIKYSFKESFTANDISHQQARWASCKDGYTTFDDHLLSQLIEKLAGLVKNKDV